MSATSRVPWIAGIVILGLGATVALFVRGRFEQELEQRAQGLASVLAQASAATSFAPPTRANERVRWTCVAHDMPSWVGTILTWTLRESGGATMVWFEHGGWKEGAPEPVVQGWKHFLASLRAYVEAGAGQPW
jgi:hypothetical protein